MDGQEIKQLVLLRAAVGFLGEQGQPPWWNSQFCSANGQAFLSPIFPRTHLLAQFQGVAAAAALVHDERIGIGNVFHLFRLPGDLEQSLYEIANGEGGQAIGDVMHSEDAARQFVAGFAGGVRKEALGPVMVGPTTAVRSISSWQDVAALYLTAFERRTEAFPFFSDRT